MKQRAGVSASKSGFNAQQAVEKALKAVLAGRGEDFPFTHDIAALIELCQDEGFQLPDDLREADRLTPICRRASLRHGRSRGGCLRGRAEVGRHCDRVGGIAASPGQRLIAKAPDREVDRSRRRSRRQSAWTGPLGRIEASARIPPLRFVMCLDIGDRCRGSRGSDPASAGGSARPFGRRARGCRGRR
jgi:HEPN domain